MIKESKKLLDSLDDLAITLLKNKSSLNAEIADIFQKVSLSRNAFKLALTKHNTPPPLPAPPPSVIDYPPEWLQTMNAVEEVAVNFRQKRMVPHLLDTISDEIYT